MVGRTVGAELSSVSAVAVSGADVVAPDPFPLKSNEVTLVGLEPTIIVALAVDASSAGADVQTGDHMILIFSAATNGFGITATNIDTTLIVSASHTWLSGSGAIVGAIWSAGAFANDTLTITLSADGGPPTVAADDTISVAINTIRDASGQVDAVGTARAIVSTFGVDEPVAAAPVPLLSAVAVAGTQSEFQSASGDYTIVVPAAASVGDLLLKLTTVAEPLPPLPAGIAIAGSPISVQITFSATGLPPSDLSAALAVIVEAPTAALGSVAVTGLIAYAFDAADGWILLPSWVDADGGKLHVEVAESRVVAVTAVTPRISTVQGVWNLLIYTGGADTPIATLLAGMKATVDAVHRWNAETQRFESAFPFAPSRSTLELVQPHDTLWIHARGADVREWPQSSAGRSPPSTARCPPAGTSSVGPARRSVSSAAPLVSSASRRRSPAGRRSTAPTTCSTPPRPPPSTASGRCTRSMASGSM